MRATRATDASAPDFVKKYVNFGASVRAAQFLVLAAKARALMQSRYHVTYEDIRALMQPILRHRILLNFHAESDRLDAGRHPEAAAGVEAGAERVTSRESEPIAESHAPTFPRSGASWPASPASTWSPRPWWTASSPACTARPISASARSSPSIAPTRPATICGTWIGTSSRAPSACYLKRYRGETNYPAD